MADLQYSQDTWLGEVPAHWAVVPAKALFSNPVERNHSDDVHLTPSQKYGVLPQAEYMEITGSRVVLNLSGADNMRHVEPGDYISHLRSFQGGLEYSPYKGKVSSAYTVLRPKQTIEPRYYKHLFKSSRYIQGLSTTTEQLRDGQSIRYEQFALLPLPFPPVEDQKAIADFLDQRLGEIERLKDSQRRLETTLKARRKALIGHTVTKGLNPGVVRVETGYSWLGEVPEHWKLGTLKRFAEIGAGSGFPIEYQGVTDEEIPFLKVNSLSKADSTGLISSREDNVSRDTARQLGAKIYSAGSIVMAKIGAALLLGRVRTIEFDSCIDNNMMAIFPKPEVFPRFLYYLLQRIPFPLIVNPGAVPSTSEGAVANLHMIMPPMSEQVEIANFLDAETRKIDQLMDRNSLMLQVLEERKLALVAAAVTGKIDVRGQN